MILKTMTAGLLENRPPILTGLTDEIDSSAASAVEPSARRLTGRR
jgi:hypothetical protein